MREQLQSVNDTPTERVAHDSTSPYLRQCATADDPGRNDLFHARVPDSFIASVFGVMAMTPQHTYQVLTKRPRRMRALLSAPAFWFRVNAAADAATDALTAVNPRWPGVPSLDPVPWPLPNVWAGTSIENDDYTWRADDLRQTPAAVRFLSLEPLIGPLPGLSLDGVDWVIVGGESGADHRKLDLAWARDIRDRCASQDTAFFFKQVGGHTPKSGGRLLDGRTWDQMPPVPPSPSAGPTQVLRVSETGKAAGNDRQD